MRNNSIIQSIFRKVAQERLASPEQLSHLRQLTSPKGWLALISLAGIILVIIIWSIFGSPAEKVNGTGTIIESGGVLRVVSMGSGQLSDTAIASDRESPEESIRASKKQLRKSQAENYPPDIQRIIDRGKLLVVMHYEDAEPFFMHDREGRFYGHDVDMARDIAKRLGVEVQFNRSAKTYDEIVDIVARREVDMAISYLSKTLERSKRVLFTDPYIELNLAVIISRLKAAQEKKGDNIAEILRFEGREVGVLRSSAHIGYVQELFPRASIKEYNIFNPDIIDAVLRGDVIAGFFDEMDIKISIRKRPELSLRLKTVIIEDKRDQIAIAVPWDSLHLLAWLNLYLKTQVTDLDADSLLEKYSEIFDK